MLLPLCVRRRGGMTIIEFPDLGVSDYNAPIIAKHFEPSFAEWDALWKRMAGALQGDFMRLEKMPRLIGSRANPLVQYQKKCRQMRIAAWGMKLPPNFTVYMERVLAPTFARELTKKRRRIAKRGAVIYTIARTPAEKRDAFNILSRQRQARCDEMGRFNILSLERYRQFYERVIVESPSFLANIGTLKVDGETIATVLTLEWFGTVYVLMSTFEGGEWKSCSLGNLTIQSAVEHAIRGGADFFDLTIGNESYKQHFGAASSELYSVLYPLTAKGMLATQALGVRARLGTLKRFLLRQSP